MPKYFPHVGGVAIVAQELSKRLVKENHTVTVYTVDLKEELPSEQRINGVLVKRYRSIIGDPLYCPSPRFFWAIRKENVDVIHVHNIHVLLTLFVVLLRKNEQKLLLQPHYHRFGQSRIRNFFFAIYKRFLDSLLFPRVDFVVLNSSYEEKIIKEDFRRCKKIKLIPEAIDINELKSVRWSPSYPWRILCVGALRKYKNVDKLLEAFALVLSREKEAFTLVIVGNGPEKRRLVELARSLGIIGHVEWKQDLSRKQLLSEYARARIYVSLSLLESFSIVVHEAIVIGVPAVVLNAGATAKLVQRGLAEGVNSYEPEEIALAITKALKRKTNRTEKIREHSIGWEQYSSELIKIYLAIHERALNFKNNSLCQ